MNKIRKGDQVIVLTGRDKGKRGTVTQRVDDERIVVEGVNIVKKHVKPNPMKGTTGGVVDKTLSIHQSNVAIFNPATGKADRVGIKLVADAKTNKTTKQLTKTVSDQNNEIAQLKTEIAALKNAASPPTVVIENAPEEETTPTADASDGR